MNKLKTDDDGGFPLELDDIRWEQAAVREAFYGFLNGFGFDSSGSMILKGCDRYTVSLIDYYHDGWLALNGEIYKVVGDVLPIPAFGEVLYWDSIESYDSTGNEQFEDTSSHGTYLIRRARVVAGPAPLYYFAFEDATLADKIAHLLAGTFATIDQPNWIAPILITSPQIWANTGLFHDADAGYMKDTIGFVHLQGVIKQSNHSVTGSSAFRLPTGYRPLKSKTFLLWEKTQAQAFYATVGDDGFVFIFHGTISADAYFDLAPISFMAEQ